MFPIYLALIFATQTASGQEAKSSARKDVAWADLTLLADHYWLMVEGQPLFYVHYQWDDEGKSLAYSGADRAGNKMAGRFWLEGAEGSIKGLDVDLGTATEIAINAIPGGFVETAAKDGETIRQEYRKTSDFVFDISLQKKLTAKWVTIKTMRFVRVTPDVVEASGWDLSFSAESQARAAALKNGLSFSERLKNAVKDGAVAGVQSGIASRAKYDRPNTDCTLASPLSQLRAYFLAVRMGVPRGSRRCPQGAVRDGPRSPGGDRHPRTAEDPGGDAIP